MSETSKNPDTGQVRQWERGWDEHERMQLQRLAALPLADKLAWLEEAHRVVMHLKLEIPGHTHLGR